MTLGRITVDGGELHCETAGAGSPVVLLHPGGLSSATWDNEFELLAAMHTVVRYDARNHGQSSTATGRYANHEDLRQLLDGLGIERAALVGLSLGARTSVDFALTWPDRVERMVLTGPGVSGMTFRDPFILAQMERMASVGPVDPIMRSWVDGPHRAPEDVDPAVRARCLELATATFERHAAGWGFRVTEVGAYDRLGELAMPITAVLGELDSSDIVDVVERITRKARDARLVPVPDAGHVVNMEQPGRFAEILRDAIPSGQ